MPEIDEEIFTNAVRQVVRDNLSFLPPYGTGGALYIRLVWEFLCNIFLSPLHCSCLLFDTLADLSSMDPGLASGYSRPMNTPW